MKEKEIIDTKSMMKDVNKLKTQLFQKDKKMDSTLKAIKSSKATNNSGILDNNRKVALQTKKTIINAFNK